MSVSSPAWLPEQIEPISGAHERFHHVAKHLYRVQERWDQVDAALGGARDRARFADCPARVLGAEWPRFDRVPTTCRAHVLGDHDRDFEPAYRRELGAAHAAGRLGALPPDPGRRSGAMYVGDAAVTIIVRTGDDGSPRVRTAYRVVPRHGDDPAAFLKEAVRKLADKTSWKAVSE